MHVLDKFKYCPACGSSGFEEQDEKSKRCKRCGFEYYLNPSAAVAAFILNSRGQLLTLRRSKAPAKGTLRPAWWFCGYWRKYKRGFNARSKRRDRINS